MQIRQETRSTDPFFPSGDSRPLAVLTAEPVVLEARRGLRFAEGLDDLDRFRYAVLDLPGAIRVWFSKHHGDPNPGTVVRIDAAADPTAARTRLTTSLKLGEGDVLWWAPDTEASTESCHRGISPPRGR